MLAEHDGAHRLRVYRFGAPTRIAAYRCKGAVVVISLARGAAGHQIPIGNWTMAEKMFEMPLLVIAILQWVHVFFAIWWFGSILVDRIETRRALRLVGPEVAAQVRAAEARIGGRRYTALVSFGTIGLGIVRGAVGGAFGRLDEPYGWTYLAAMTIGLAMLGWLWLPIPDGPYTPLGRKVYVACFPLMFTLMVLMRFGY